MNLNNKKHIIFDWDGTLVDSLEMWANTDIALLKKLGKTPEDNIGLTRNDFLHSHNSGTIFLSYNQFLIENYEIKDITPEELERKRMDIITLEEAKKIDLKPGAEEFLHLARKRGYVLSLATLTSKALLNYYATQNNNVKNKTKALSIFNGVILSNDDVKEKKPNAEVYLKALEKTGYSSEESIVIEDSLTGVTASKSAGICTIAIYDKYNDEDREKINELVDYQIQNYSELIKILS